MHHIDAVARQLRLGHVDLGSDHRLDPEGQVGHGDLLLHTVVDAVDRAVVIAGKMQNRLAHGLRGDGPGVDADAADDGAGLDHRDALLHLGCGHGRPLPRGAGAYHDQVVLDGAHASVSAPGRNRPQPRRFEADSCDGPLSEATIGRGALGARGSVGRG